MTYRLIKKTTMSGYTCEYCGGYHRTPPCDTCGMPDFMCVFFVDHSSGGRLHQKNARRRDGKVGFAVFRRKNGRRESEGAA